MNEDFNKVRNFINLLNYNEEYSKCITLYEFLAILKYTNPLFKEKIEQKTPNFPNFEDFSIWLKKSILCFPALEEINFIFLLTQIPYLKKIKLNNDWTLNDLLANSMIEILEKNTIKEIQNYCQLIGIQMESLGK
jgi:hypothetical protein